MLGGYFPFGNSNDLGAHYRRISRAEFTFDDNSGWKDVSEDAKDLITRLLVADPCARMTIDGCFKHPWVRHQLLLLEKLYKKTLREDK